MRKIGDIVRRQLNNDQNKYLVTDGSLQANTDYPELSVLCQNFRNPFSYTAFDSDLADATIRTLIGYANIIDVAVFYRFTTGTRLYITIDASPYLVILNIPDPISPSSGWTVVAGTPTVPGVPLGLAVSSRGILVTYGTDYALYDINTFVDNTAHLTNNGVCGVGRDGFHCLVRTIGTAIEIDSTFNWNTNNVDDAVHSIKLSEVLIGTPPLMVGMSGVVHTATSYTHNSISGTITPIRTFNHRASQCNDLVADDTYLYCATSGQGYALEIYNVATGAYITTTPHIAGVGKGIVQNNNYICLITDTAPYLVIIEKATLKFVSAELPLVTSVAPSSIAIDANNNLMIGFPDPADNISILLYSGQATTPPNGYFFVPFIKPDFVNGVEMKVLIKAK